MFTILSLLVISCSFSAYASLEPCETVGQLKSDAEICHKFYQCTHNGWAPLNCLNNLYFNPEISVCDWPKPGTKCGNDIDRNAQSKLDACEAVGQLKADAENCENFYQCTHNGWAPLHCQAGLFFNSEISVCDWPKPGTKCGKDTNTDDHSGVEPCDTVGELKADADNCQNFYQCTHNGWEQLHCASGLFFNSEISVCDWPKSGSKCGGNNDTDHNSGDHDDDGHNNRICKEIGQIKADTKHCDLYYKCTSCGWSLVSCESGLLFNPEISVCDEAERVTCAKDGVLDPCQNVNQLKSDTERCDHYYKCTTRGWGSLPCGTGLLFNSKTLACESADKVKCGNDDHSGDQDHHDDHSGDHEHDDHSGEPVGPCKVGAFKPDPKNCNRYYHCTTYGWQNMPCYDHLVFNPSKSICDYSYNFKCEIRSN